MTKKTTIYTTEKCPACVQIKAKFQAEGREYEEVRIVDEVNSLTYGGRQISRAEFLHTYPWVRTVPFVIEV